MSNGTWNNKEDALPPLPKGRGFRAENRMRRKPQIADKCAATGKNRDFSSEISVLTGVVNTFVDLLHIVVGERERGRTPPMIKHRSRDLAVLDRSAMSDEEIALRIYNAGLRSCGTREREELGRLKSRQLAELA